MKFDLTIWLIVALTISCGANVFLIWYLRKLLSRFMFVSENLNDLVQIIANYQKHLVRIYSLDMFYGDETLKFLMSHTNSLIEVLKDYEDVYSISVPIETQGEEEFDEEDTKKTEDEKEIFPTQKITQENVFYAGSRKRNN